MAAMTETLAPGAWQSVGLYVSQGHPLSAWAVATIGAPSIHVYVVDADNFARFQDGHTLTYFGPGETNSPWELRQFALPDGPWWLVVYNPNAYPVHLDYGFRSSLEDWGSQIF